MSDNAFIALGSNLSDPADQLRVAAAHLKARSVAGFTTSSIWQSEPEGFDESVGAFCNAVIKLRFDGSAAQLLAIMQHLEVLLGRKTHSSQAGGYESRKIDLDLIDFGGEIHSKSDLLLPHPRAHLRRFVLIPLQEIDAGFSFPNHPETLDVLIKQAPGNSMINKGPLIPAQLD